MMTSSATHKRVLITGASRGIGRATAIALAARGYRVVLAARDQAALTAVQTQIRDAGGHAEVVAMDLTDRASVEAGAREALARGTIDVLVNNAGIASQAEFLEQPEATRQAEMELNYFGMQRITRAVLPAMIERGDGLIVNVSTLLGTVGTATTANYSGTKAALEAFSHGLRGEVSRFGIRVTVFVAPHTQTEMGRHTDFRGVKSLPVTYVAGQLARAIERAPRRHPAGPVYRVLLWLAAWFPAFMEARLLASVQHRLLPRRTHHANTAEVSLSEP